MSDHKFVINRKTGVVFGRNKQLDAHPDCVPYYPEAEKPAAVAPPSKRSRKAASPATTAAAAIAAAETAATPIEEVDFTQAAAQADAGAEE